MTGKFAVEGTTIKDPNADIPIDGLMFSVNDIEWPFFKKAIVMLNKPEGYECSLKPSHYPTVLSLLPNPLRRRNVQPVGRLDADTKGLLLLTDDGQLNHRLTHPKQHIIKTYLVETKYPVTEKQILALASGVDLKGGDGTVKAQSCVLSDPTHLVLTITQGKYHQVKRMISAVSNRTESLKRIGFGKLNLPNELPEGRWEWIPEASWII